MSTQWILHSSTVFILTWRKGVVLYFMKFCNYSRYLGVSSKMENTPNDHEIPQNFAKCQANLSLNLHCFPISLYDLVIKNQHTYCSLPFSLFICIKIFFVATCKKCYRPLTSKGVVFWGCNDVGWFGPRPSQGGTLRRGVRLLEGESGQIMRRGCDPKT